MSKYTIGIDFGTLSGRAVLVDVRDGRELAVSTMDYPHGVISETLPGTDIKLPPDWALQDPQDYLDVLGYVVPEVIRKSGVNPGDIIGIGIDFTACTMLPVRADGRPLSFEEKFKHNPHAYVKLWKHHAAQKYADRINATARARSESWLGRYGGKISSEWMFPKIWQVFEEAPEVYHDAAYFIEAADWVTWQLTGKQTRSYLFAAFKCMYIPEAGGYPSEDFFAALDEGLRYVVRDKMNAPIIFTCEPAGYVTPEAAAKFGLPAGIAVACPMPDAHTAPVALGLCKDGDMCAIMGTSACYMLIGDKITEVPGICGVAQDGLIPGHYGYEAGLCCVGDHFAWAKENVVTADYIREAEARGISVLKLLIEKASKLAPGESGLVALDWFNGNRNILNNASLSGVIVGLTLATKPEHIMRALIEATAFGTRVIFENFAEHGVSIKRIVAAGGISRKDPFTMQLYADVLKTDIEVTESAQAPALADAIQAAVAAGSHAGGYDSLGDAMAAMASRCDRVYRPDPVAGAVYDKLCAEYKILHDYFGRGENNVMKRLRELAGAGGQA